MPSGNTSGLIATASPLRAALMDALAERGYAPSSNATGDSIISPIVTSGPIGWLAEFALHPASAVIVASVALSVDFQPNIKSTDMQDLLTRLNNTVVFGCYLLRSGGVGYRTARDFPGRISAARVGKFLGQLAFPLRVWAEVCGKFPKNTTIQDRIEASLIRLGAHDGADVTRRTRRALLRLMSADEPSTPTPPNSVGLLLI